MTILGNRGLEDFICLQYLLEVQRWGSTSNYQSNFVLETILFAYLTDAISICCHAATIHPVYQGMLHSTLHVCGLCTIRTSTDKILNSVNQSMNAMQHWFIQFNVGEHHALFHVFHLLSKWVPTLYIILFIFSGWQEVSSTCLADAIRPGISSTALEWTQLFNENRFVQEPGAERLSKQAIHAPSQLWKSYSNFRY